MAVIPFLLFTISIRADSVKDVCEKMHLTLDVRSADFSDQGRGYKVTGGQVTENSMQKYSDLWVKEWSKYSSAVFEKAKVTKVVFGEKLSFSGQVRAAVPAWDLNTMYYDPALGNYNPNYQRNVIHHEFFHMMDYRMGKLSRDPEWAKLNPKSFHYGSGGAKMRDPKVGVLTSEIPGFLTMYGTAAIEEDKAELYSHLLIDPDFVAKQAAKDTVLAAKIALLKSRMSAWDPVFNADFWTKPQG